MEYPVAVLDRPANRLDVAQIAGDDLHLVDHGGVVPVERPAIVARVVADERPNARPCAHQVRREVAADEAARASHQDAPAGGTARGGWGEIGDGESPWRSVRRGDPSRSEPRGG